VLLERRGRAHQPGAIAHVLVDLEAAGQGVAAAAAAGDREAGVAGSLEGIALGVVVDAGTELDGQVGGVELQVPPRRC
jgi:hypothetical protein